MVQGSPLSDEGNLFVSLCCVVSFSNSAMVVQTTTVTFYDLRYKNTTAHLVWLHYLVRFSGGVTRASWASLATPKINNITTYLGRVEKRG